MSLRLKLTILFIVVAVIPSFFIGAITFHNYRNSLEAAHLSELQKIVAFKADKIETYFAGLRSAIELARSLYVIKKNLPALDRFSSEPDSAAFLEAKAMVDGPAQQMQAAFALLDVMVVNPRGKTIYSSNPGHYPADFLQSLPDAGQRAFEEGKDKVYISDIFLNKTEGNRPGMLVAAPVFDFDGTFIGLIVLKVDLEPVYKLIRDTAGMGETGETLLGKRIGNEAVFLNPLRHDPDAALKRKVFLEQEFGGPIQKAVQGLTGAGEMVDYRGRRVVAAWKHLPSLDWGVVAKIDSREALADVENLKLLAMFILVIGSVLSGIMAFYIARSISGPVKKLARGAEIVGSGNLDYKVALDLDDEIGQLSRAFDKMTSDLKAITASRDELDREIGARKRLEEGLKESQAALEGRVRARTAELATERQRFFSVLEALPVYVVLLDKDYRMPFANRFFRERFGESHGRRCYEYLFNRSGACENCESYKAMKTNAPHHWEWLGPDGRNYDIFDYPFTDTDGSMLILEMGIDISERKKAEEALKKSYELLELRVQERTKALRESEEDLTRAQAVALTGSWRLDVHKNELLWSRETYRIFGIAPGTPLTYERFLEAVFPEDREHVDKKWKEAFAGGKYDIEHRIIADGMVKWVREKAELEFDDKGSLLSGFGTAQDITQIKSTEETLRQTKDYLEKIFNYANAPIICWDTEFRITRFNHAFEHLSGFKADEVLGKHLSILFPRDTRDESLARIEKTLSGEYWQTVEIPILRKDGRVRIALWNSANIYAEDGKTLVATIAQGQDITERKLIEQELRFTQFSVDRAAEAIFWIKPDAGVYYVNDQASRALGYSRQELLNMTVLDIDQNFSREAWQKHWEEVKKYGSFTLESVHRAKDGTTFPVEVTVNYLKMGEREYNCAFVRDISERKSSEEALRRAHAELEERVALRTGELRNLNEQLNQEIIERKEVEHHIYARNVLLKLLNKTASRAGYLESVVKLISGWSGCRCVGIRLKNSEGRIPYEAFRGFSREFWESESPLSLEKDQCICIRAFQGRFLPVESQALTAFGSFRSENTLDFAVSFPEEDKPKFRGRCIKEGFKSVAIIPVRYMDETIGAIHLADEREGKVSLKLITSLESLAPLVGEGIYRFNLSDAARKNAELLERVFSSTNLLIAYLDSGFNFIRVNQEYAALDGKAPDFFVGRNLFSLYPDEENQAIFTEVIRSGEPYVAFARPLGYKHDAGHKATYWDWSLQPVKDSDGNVSGIILLLVDVTRRKAAEEELLRTQAQLIESKRLSDIGTLAATVAHELRNPLAAIHMAAYNIKRKAQDPMFEKHLHTIEKKINESEQIISNLLFYSRIKAPRLEKTRISEIIDECTGLVEGRHPERKITLSRRLGALKQVVLEGDPLQLKEVFSNILNNAYEAIPAESGRIEIHAVRDKHSISVRVQDNGMGIDKEHLERIFDPFFTTKAKGTGLGLTVCKQILNLHGGTLGIESEKGKGTTVTVNLPLKKAGNEKKHTRS
ncbi:MAG: PAS domain S-box protein [Candidatus Omnitrophica bacterium]|nr:PAS domain S-box protein [Candidatus Omnitrophota bacterium]